MKQVTIVGIGMGNGKTLTVQAVETIKQAEVLLGASRMIEAVREYAPSASIVPSYKSGEITSYIKESQKMNYVVVMSGDTGFHSGTKELRKELLEAGITPEVLPGISSVSYLFSKIGMSWEDAYLVSMHGNEVDVIRAVEKQEKTFFLTGGNVSLILKRLADAGFGEAIAYVGENLSYEDEKIIEGPVSQLQEGSYAKLSVLVIVTSNRKRKVENTPLCIGLEDEAFLRGKVPMTKSEVRAVILSKLRLKPGTIAYDVGAGTGSVSIEMALNIGTGSVYAIETKDEATQLITQNKEKFQAEALTIVQGEAPEALGKLPCPASVFIGGSKGNMEGILTTILDKLPLQDKEHKIQFVVSAIALETMTETLQLFQKLEFEEVDIAQVQVSKSKNVGKYHMMMGQNPIYIISGRKGTSRES